MWKILSSVMIVCLLLGGYIVQVELVNREINSFPVADGPVFSNGHKELTSIEQFQSQNVPKPPSSPLLPFRQVLKPNDEGSHYRNHLMTQEWWYYNAFFDKSDSELRNWSLMISFNQMGTADIFFMTLYDEGNTSYGGAVTEDPGVIKATSPGVNVEFNNSYAIGMYPNWHIYTEDEDLNGHNISLDLIYKANSLPLWFFFNTGHNISMSPAGHYCISGCDVTGEVKINGTVYNVHGVGYHEHSWFTFLPEEKGQTSIDVWDWFCIHFDNGWDMFAGKLLRQSPFARFMPGSLWITPDGENITECFFFKVEYLETQETSIPSVEIPTKIHINALIVNTLIKNPLKGMVYVDVYIETRNILEYLWGSPPSIGMWEGPCKIHGTIKWFRNKIDLNGWGMMELTRVAP